MWEDRNISLFLGIAAQVLLVNGVVIQVLSQCDRFFWLIARSLHPSWVCTLHFRSMFVIVVLLAEKNAIDIFFFSL